MYKKQSEIKLAEDNLSFIEVKTAQEIKFSSRQAIRIDTRKQIYEIMKSYSNFDKICFY